MARLFLQFYNSKAKIVHDSREILPKIKNKNYLVENLLWKRPWILGENVENFIGKRVVISKSSLSV